MGVAEQDFTRLLLVLPSIHPRERGGSYGYSKYQGCLGKYGKGEVLDRQLVRGQASMLVHPEPVWGNIKDWEEENGQGGHPPV